MKPASRQPRAERDRRELEVLHRLAVELPQSLTVAGVMDTLSRELTHSVDRAEECTISSWNEQADELTILSSYGREGGVDPTWCGVAYPLSKWPRSRELLSTGGSHITYRISDPEFDDTVRCELRDWQWYSWLALPLSVEGRSVGLIEVADYRSSRAWARRDISFCQTIAGQAAMAVRNAQLYEDLARRVDHDSLTGLLTHGAFYKRLGEEIARAGRDGTPVTLLAIDLDDFKAVNDRDGHLAGDRTLRTVADVLREGTRVSDVIGRLGGDEFAVAIPEPTAVAAEVAARINTQLLAKVGLSASIGVAELTDAVGDAAELVDRADKLLLEVKRSGKRGFRLWAA
jgi:diguanylate cyclase (GGDEF)-like protein